MTPLSPMPPAPARVLVRLLLPAEIRDEMEGDLLEGYQQVAARFGSWRATLWYGAQLLSIRPFALRSSLKTKQARSGYRTHKVNTMSEISSGVFDSLGDLRYAFRGFLRSPLHAVMTVAILAVGIGAVTLMFSALNASVLRPLPYPHGEELMWVWKTSERVSRNSLSWDDYLDYRDGVEAFEEAGAIGVFYSRHLLTGGEGAERLRSQIVTASLFSTLGASPWAGSSHRRRRWRGGLR